MDAKHAIEWARMVAPVGASEDDVKRIAGALMQAARDARIEALEYAASGADRAISRIRIRRDAARLP